MGVAQIANDLIPAALRHRLVVAWVDGVVKGGIYLISVYPKDSQGLGESNMWLLEVIAAIIATLRGPWIAAGDWNMDPNTMLEAGWPQTLGARLVFPDRPTYESGDGQSKIGFFFVESSIADAILSCTAVRDPAISTHAVVRLEMT